MVPVSSGYVEFSEHIWIFWNQKLKSKNLREFQVCVFPLDFGCCFFPTIKKFWYMVVNIFAQEKVASDHWNHPTEVYFLDLSQWNSVILEG